jgi:PAS domain S-box-containing protein
MIMDKKPAYEELERKVQEFDIIESEHKKTMAALQKRVKELNCLYGISHFVESEKNLPEILQETVNLVTGSLQYPEVAACRISLNDNSYSSCPHCETACDHCSHAFMRQPIIVNGVLSGEVRVCYLEEKREADEGPFLREERALINAVAERLGRIVERKRAEEALRNSEQLLNSMGSIAKIGGWEHDLLTGKAVWTREVYKIAEIESGPIPGPGEHLNYYSPESRMFLDEAYRRAIEAGEPFDVKLQCNTAKGHQIWARVIGHPEFKDGKCVKMKGTLQDITEQKRVEDALQESEEKYRLLVENANDAIFIAQDEVIKFPNPRTTEILGYSENELSEIPFKNLIHPEDKEMVMERYFQRLKGGKFPSSYSFRIINKSGDESWVQLNAALITWEDRPATINLIRDITEQRQLENQLRQSQKMESIGTLAGGIAHDFNNILGIILGNTELALDDVPEWNPARLNLEEVITASIRARDVIRQLLSFARKTKLERRPTNITPIIKESLKLLRASIPTSIDIRQNIPEDIDTILADPTQINQVLINLCTNADHSMPHGGIIEVTLENVEVDEESMAQYPGLHPGRYVHLIVSDTGQGISQKDIYNIFDPYFTTKDVGRGTGMGLAVVHGIVKEHNGIITVKSKLGKGTAFGLFFPAVENEAVVGIVTDEALPTGNERILFIDDEESIVKLGRQRLERLGYHVETATSPIEALAMFQSKPHDFDLIISDMTMPDMTGDRLVKEILNIRPNLPIILCTGFSEKIDESKAAAIGAADYIEKPLGKRDFAFKVREVLEKAKGNTQG